MLSTLFMNSSSSMRAGSTCARRSLVFINLAGSVLLPPRCSFMRTYFCSLACLKGFFLSFAAQGQKYLSHSSFFFFFESKARCVCSFELVDPKFSTDTDINERVRLQYLFISSVYYFSSVRAGKVFDCSEHQMIVFDPGF